MDTRLQLIIEAQNKASQQLNQIARDVSDLSGSVNSNAAKMASGFDSVSSAINIVKVAVAGIAFGKIAEATKDVAMAAARFETLGVVMNTVGANAGYTSTQMDGFAASLQKTGISMTGSREAITKMAQSQLDLTKSTELARIAQDAAVIGNMNSSEALSHMVYGIQSAQVEVLRTIGINVNFENSYKTLADQLGKTKDQLTESEKATARQNAVLAAGPAIAGAYEASMETAGKQLLSMTRYAEDLKVMLGEVFTPALGVIIGQINEKWKAFNADVKGSKDTIRDWGKTTLDVVSIIVSGFEVMGKAVYAVRGAFGETMAWGANKMAEGLESSIKDMKSQLSDAQNIGFWSRFLGDDEDARAAKIKNLTETIGQFQNRVDSLRVTQQAGNAQSTAAAESYVSLGSSVSALQQKLEYAGSSQKQVSDAVKKATSDQMSSEGVLLAQRERYHQTIQDGIITKEAQSRLTNSTDGIYLQEQAYNKLVSTVKSNPIYKDIEKVYGTDAAEKWAKDTISAYEKHEKAAVKSYDSQEKAAQKLADSWGKMSEKLNVDIDQTGLTKIQAEFVKIDAEAKNLIQTFGEIPGALDEIGQWANSEKVSALLKQEDEDMKKLLADMQAEIDLEEKRKKQAAEESQAINNMYKDMGASAEGYYKQERELLLVQYNKYAEFVTNKDILNKWYDGELKKINDKEILMSNDFFAGMKIGYEELQKDAMTWAKAGQKLIKDFASQGSKAMSDGFFDIITGQCDDLEEIWTNLWQSMLKTMTDIIAQMLMNDLLKLLFGGSTTGLTLNIAGLTGVSATDAAKGALSLSSVYDSFAAGLTYVTDALGLTSSSSVALATTVDEMVTSYLAVDEAVTALTGPTIEAANALAELGLAAQVTSESTVALATTVDELVDGYLATTTVTGGTAAAEMSAMSTLGAAAAVAGVVYFIGSGAFEEVVGGLFGYSDQSVSTEEMESALRAAEAGFITLSEETQNLYKTMILGLDEEWDTARQEGGYTNNETGAYEYSNDIYNLTQDWYEAHEDLLNMTMAEYDKLMAQQSELMAIAENTWMDMQAVSANAGDYGYENVGSPIGDTMGEAYVELAIKIADDATLPLEQKMYQLGFVAKDSGGWQSDATMAMLAEFSDQGVPWSEINKVLTDIGALGANEDVIKNIYAVYHGVDYWPTWESVEAALTAVGYDSEVIKAIKTEFSGDMTYDELSKLIYDAYTSPDMLAEVMVMIDPSDEWKDLVIPVDAPESIPVSWDGQPMGMATGGPVSAGTPYIIGEVGPELFVPQESGHILSNSNMKKLMGMGVQGFADGTTDEWEDPFEYMAEMNQQAAEDAANQTYDPSPSSSYESLAEWQADYNKQLEEYLGLTTDLGDALTDITDYYTEQIQIATELGATSEQLAQLAIDQEAAKAKAIQDWYDSETEYYNQMMGLNTELGDTLDDIASHYDAAIASAEAAGLSEEELAKIRETEATVAAQAMADWYASETEYYNQMMGLNTALGDTLDGINQHYDEAIASAEAAGLSEEELAKIREAESAVSQKAIEDWYKSYEDYVNSTMGLTTSLGDQIAAINEYYAALIAESYIADPTGATAADMAADQAAMIQKAIEDWAKSYSDYVDDMLGNTSQLADDLAKVNEYYAEQLATAEEIGMTDTEINQMLADQAAIQQQILEDYVKEYNEWLLDTLGIHNNLADSMNSITDYYDQMLIDLDAIEASDEVINQLLEQEQAVLEVIAYQTLADMAKTMAEINGYATEMSSQLSDIAKQYAQMLKDAYTLVQMDLARPITLAIIAMSAGLSLLNVVGKSRADEEAQAIEDISNASQDRYDTESKAIDDLKGQMDDLQNIVDSITSKMQDLKYSKYNLTLPSQTMANAEGDYAALLAKAQTGDADAVAAYMDFVDTYLQSAQSQYKSSGDYQAIYDQVMQDLAGVQENAQNQLTLDQQLLMAMEAELSSISGSSGTTAENTDALVEAQETVFSNIAAVLTSAASVLDDFVANYAEELPLLTAAIDSVATAIEAMAERLTEISDWFIEGMTNGFTADGFVKTIIMDIYTKISAFVDRLNDIGNVIYTIGLSVAKLFPTLSEKMIEVGAELAHLSPSLQDFFADMKVLAEYIKSLTPNADSEYASQTASNTDMITKELFALNNYLKIPGYYEEPVGYASGGISTGPTSGYPVTLHGTEAIIPLSGGAIPVTLSGGQSDPEVKALLQELVAVSRGKQNVTITTDDGVSFRGYIRREADTVRIEAASRPGMETKRIYN